MTWCHTVNRANPGWQTDPACWFHDESWYLSVTWAADSQSVNTGVAFNHALPLSMLVHLGHLVCAFSESHGELLDVSSRKAWGTSQAEAADWPTRWRSGVDSLKSWLFFRWCVKVTVYICSSGGINSLRSVMICGESWNTEDQMVTKRQMVLANNVLCPCFGDEDLIVWFFTENDFWSWSSFNYLNINDRRNCAHDRNIMCRSAYCTFNSIIFGLFSSLTAERNYFMMKPLRTIKYRGTLLR